MIQFCKGTISNWGQFEYSNKHEEKQKQQMMTPPLETSVKKMHGNCIIFSIFFSKSMEVLVWNVSLNKLGSKLNWLMGTHSIMTQNGSGPLKQTNTSWFYH